MIIQINPIENSEIPNSTRQLDTQYRLFVQDAIKREISLVVVVKTKDSNGTHLVNYDQRFTVKAVDNSNIFKRDPTTGEPIYAFVEPESTTPKYVNGKITPVDNEGNTKDWLKDSNGDYIKNPFFVNGIQEYTYFEPFLNQAISVNNIIDNMLVFLNDLNRFNEANN